MIIAGFLFGSMYLTEKYNVTNYLMNNLIMNNDPAQCAFSDKNLDGIT